MDPTEQSVDSLLKSRVLEELTRAPGVERTDLGVDVADGAVTLSGTATHQHQREAATRAARHLEGVRDVRNDIVLAPPVSLTDLRAGIEDDLVRHAVLAAQKCAVSVDEHGAVRIDGTARTWAEKAAIGRVARAAPGVTAVDNRLEVLS